ncbi:MAG TPA: hypothetical protein ENJ82_06150 [Bacteroidetes bacterium]|nr:hypothetical protein [Bacteroidota bacterium]
MGLALIGFLIASSLIIASAVLLIQKGRGILLLINIGILVIYEVSIVAVAVNAPGWDGLAWFLGGLLIGGAHLIVLFILALALPSLKTDTSQGQDPFSEQEDPFSQGPH